MELLLDRGAPIDGANIHGMEPPQRAAFQITKFPLTRRAVVDIVSGSPLALHHAAVYELLDVAEILPDAGVPVDKLDALGRRVLHYAVTFDAFEVLSSSGQRCACE